MPGKQQTPTKAVLRKKFTSSTSPIYSKDTKIRSYDLDNPRSEMMPDKDAYPCATMIASKKPIGNVFSSDWKTLWHRSGVLKIYRNLQCSAPCCQNCDCSAFCAGGCPEYKSLLGLSVTEQADPRCFRQNTLLTPEE